ncbi:hypothetical protein SCUP234_00590 [Seiridium cupressi]
MSSSPVDTVQPFPGAPFIPAPAADNLAMPKPSPELPSPTDVQPSLPGLPWFPAPLGDVADEPGASPQLPSPTDIQPSLPGIPWFPAPLGDVPDEPTVSPRSSSSADDLPPVVDTPNAPIVSIQPFPVAPFVPTPITDTPDKPAAASPQPSSPVDNIQPSFPGIPWFPAPLGDVPEAPPSSNHDADETPVIDTPNEPMVSIQPFPFAPNPVGDDTAEPAALVQPPNDGVDWIQALKIDIPGEPVALTESSNPGVPWIQALEVPSPDEKVTLSQPSNPGVDWIQALVVDTPSTGGIHATPSGLHSGLTNTTTPQPSTGANDLSGSHTLAVVGLALSIFAYVLAAGVNANLKTKQRYPDTAPNQPGAKFRLIWIACYFVFYLLFMPVISLWGVVQALVAGALLIGQHVFKRETRRADWVFRVLPIQLPRGTFTREGNRGQDVLPRHEYPEMSPRLVAQEVEGADARTCATNPFPTLTKVGKVWIPKSRA